MDLTLIDSFINYIRAEKNLSENTAIAYRTDLELFYKFCLTQKVNLISVTAGVISDYFVDIFLEKNIEVSSHSRKFSVLNNFFTFLLNEGKISVNPLLDLSRPKLGQNLPNFLTKEEIDALIERSRKDRSKNGVRICAILELLYSSGMRISECLSIKLSDILDKNKAILETAIIKGKGSKERIIFINEDAKSAINKYLLIRGSFCRIDAKNDYLFCSDSKAGIFSRGSFFYALKNLAYLAKIDPEKVSPHKIRHSFATHMFRNGIDLKILQDLLGHSDISTTEIYTHVIDSDLIQTVEDYHPLSKNKTS